MDLVAFVFRYLVETGELLFRPAFDLKFDTLGSRDLTCNTQVDCAINCVPRFVESEFRGQVDEPIFVCASFRRE